MFERENEPPPIAAESSYHVDGVQERNHLLLKLHRSLARVLIVVRIHAQKI
jgi:hypothetical protein